MSWNALLLFITIIIIMTVIIIIIIISFTVLLLKKKEKWHFWLFFFNFLLLFASHKQMSTRLVYIFSISEADFFENSVNVTTIASAAAQPQRVCVCVSVLVKSGPEPGSAPAAAGRWCSWVAPPPFLSVIFALEWQRVHFNPTLAHFVPRPPTWLQSRDVCGEKHI